MRPRVRAARHRRPESGPRRSATRAGTAWAAAGPILARAAATTFAVSSGASASTSAGTASRAPGPRLPRLQAANART